MSQVVASCKDNPKLCARVIGIPTPKLYWKKDSQMIEDNDKFNAIHSGENCCLIVKNCSMSDSGMYTCTAKNIEGEAECVFQLDVADST